MKAYLYAVIAAVLSGTIGVLVKLIDAGSDVHFMTLNFYRIFFGFLFLLAVVPLIDKKVFRVSMDTVKEYFMVGLFLTIALSLYVTANYFAPVNNVSIVATSAPFFILFLAYFMLGEKITTTKIVTLLIAVVGIAIINPFKFEGYVFGNSLALIGSLFYAMLVIGERKEDKKHGFGAVLWFFMFASILLLPFPFIFGFGDLYGVWHLILLLGLFSTGMAYLFYNLALQSLEAEIESIVRTLITPLVSIFLAVIVIGEGLTTRIMIGGGMLILAGIYLETHSKRLKRMKK
jgi:drug/metabolite transporter (DMT)-like permease